MSGNEDVRVGRYTIPESELEWSFSPSGGPGGQHANRSNTRADLRYDLGASDVFPEAVRQWMLERLGTRASGGVIAITADDSRSQWRNRSIARARLADLLADAQRRPTQRRPTRPTRASKQRRIEAKRSRSEVKRLRKPPRPD